MFARKLVPCLPRQHALARMAKTLSFHILAERRLSISSVINRAKTTRARQFLDLEAELSDDADGQVSSDENDDFPGDFDASFVDDATQKVSCPLFRFKLGATTLGITALRIRTYHIIKVLFC
jgi:hypothetical protein